ncbi:MAG: NAD(P)/FAD-dependent oxidoreductase [Hyphomonadaceae bacterium]
MSAEHFDVLIVGAGLSGIGAAVHLGKQCPGKSYVILEARDAIGGTWDLFRYPGIRSDSDMYTLGYAFKPWTEQKAIADGPSIRKYVNETAREYGVAEHIRFKHKVTRCTWSSEEARWTVEAESEGAIKRFTARFLFACSGYYNYEHGHLPEWKGVQDYKGAFVEPQHWPQDLDHAGKRVLIIGSGATAVTLAPSMAETAAHVTMLQRSPTYMISMPAEDALANSMRRWLPQKFAYDLTRLRKILFQQLFFRLARSRPQKTKERLLGLIRDQLGPDYDMDTHFTPRYNPWEQRLCLVPDNDMFEAIRGGKVSVVTDTIENFTAAGVKLSSGEELEADIIVAATGLALQMFGGAEIFVDGAKVNTGERYVYRGTMLSDVPNLAFVFGYTNASWTLKADLVSEYVCRLINYMDEYGLSQCTPRLTGEHEDRPFADFSSGYFQRAQHILPKQTDRAPWRLFQSYGHDLLNLRYGAIEDGVLEFKPRAEGRRAPGPARAEEMA